MKRAVIDIVNRVLNRAGARIVRDSDLYPWQRAADVSPEASQALPISAEALAYLTPENPRLVELRAIYGAFDPVVTSPLVWVDDIVTEDDLKCFRGDNAFVYQLRGLQYNELGYALTTYYTLSSAEGAVLEKLVEDGAFGAHTLTLAGRVVSRDLLDSAREIQFITEHVAPAVADGPLKVLDIGAGYGRLPHRLTQALGANVEVYATDGFPFSTFISEFYLRRCGSPATVVPLHEFEALLDRTAIDLAVNIHSFSECTVDAIDWWVSRLARHGVRYLMIIPNGESKEELIPCRTNDGRDMEEIFSRHGYSCVVREFRYADPIVRRYGIDEFRYADPIVRRYGIDPAQLNLFKLG